MWLSSLAIFVAATGIGAAIGTERWLGKVLVWLAVIAALGLVVSTGAGLWEAWSPWAIVEKTD